MEDRRAWERTGAFEVAPGVHRIPLPLPNDGLRAVNIYAVADGDDVVLIDAGWALAESAELLAAGLDVIGYGLRDVREFLVTHAHRDHYTQAVALRRTFGNQVSLGEGEQATLDAIQAGTTRGDLDAELRAIGAASIADELEGRREEIDLADWQYPDRWLPNNIELPLQTRSLRVIATPGHTRGHVVFHDPGHELLFAGDHVLPHITPSISVEPNKPRSPLRDYLASLQLVRALPDARLLPAHGPVTDSVHDRIEALLAHHDERLADTALAVGAGAGTPYEVAALLPWTRRRTRFADLDVFNRMLAVQETRAHLQVLLERGRLTESHVDGIVHFQRV